MIRIESREQILQDHSRVWTEAPWRSPNSNRNFLLPSLNPLGLGAATTEAPHTCHGPAQVCRCSCPTPPALMPLMVPSPDPPQQGGTVRARPAQPTPAGPGGLEGRQRSNAHILGAISLLLSLIARVSGRLI